MPEHTREKILEAALDLFSRRGYEAVSVREIAKAVGIRESSLYNHFKGKRDIFDSLVDACWKRAEEYFRVQGLPFSEKEDLSVFGERDFSRLAETVLGVFRYFFEDPWNRRFRRLLILSQFSDPRAEELYRRLYRDYPMEVQRAVFAKLMEAGQFQRGDPEALALEFYGGVFLLLHTCDSWEEASPRLLSHLKQFTACHQLPAPKEEKGESL